ncbi:hypothetical protein, partial [Salmonella enterica]|uniref:hypothetical protein n=1 Tax=Salmonella enterica TaxID=28901 RepID=UPI001C7F9399
VGNIQFDELCVRGSYSSHPLSIRSACLSMLLIGLALAFVTFWIIGFEITAADFAGYRRHFVVI